MGKEPEKGMTDDKSDDSIGQGWWGAITNIITINAKLDGFSKKFTAHSEKIERLQESVARHSEALSKLPDMVELAVRREMDKYSK